MTTRPSQSPQKRRTTSLSGNALFALLLLLILPALALSRIGSWIDWPYLVGVPVALSLLSFQMVRSDKRRAEAGAWRISELALHTIELIGGWPGAFLAQRKFRHKTAKTSYQAVFWAIVALHQYLAFDSMLAWRLTEAAVRFVKSQTT